ITAMVVPEPSLPAGSAIATLGTAEGTIIIRAGYPDITGGDTDPRLLRALVARILAEADRAGAAVVYLPLLPDAALAADQVLNAVPVVMYPLLTAPRRTVTTIHLGLPDQPTANVVADYLRKRTASDDRLTGRAPTVRTVPPTIG